MDRGIRRVGIGIVAAFLALVVQLSYVQVLDARRLASHPGNVRAQIANFSRARGEIISADGLVLASSRDVDDEFGSQREYPHGALFGHITGYQSFVLGNTGVEATYDELLSGSDPRLQTRHLDDLLAGRSVSGDVILTLNGQAQQAAHDALAGRRGSVVVLDPRNGAVIAMYSEPGFDPTILAGHSSKDVTDAHDALTNDPLNPELPRAYRERYPAGSTFKIITTAAAIEAGVATVDRSFPDTKELNLPLTDNTLKNFGGKSCGGTLAESFRISCNTTFGQLGLDLGESLVEAIDRFGIGVDADPPPIDLRPGASSSTGPPAGTFEQDAPNFAYAAIGQGDVAVTPLQMALVACAVANGGEMMAPHVVDRVDDQDGVTIETVSPKLWRRAMNPETAAIINGLMVEVVARGTGTAAQIPGITVAGKTGTAQVSAGSAPHAWFVGFAPAQAPRFAIAVIIESGGDMGNEATGGRIAAPVAQKVLSTLLSPVAAG